MDEDVVALLSLKLHDGWMKYTNAFGEPPHGTKKQLASLIQMSGGDRMLKKIISGVQSEEEKP